jgi:hypothetical protein
MAVSSREVVPVIMVGAGGLLLFSAVRNFPVIEGLTQLLRTGDISNMVGLGAAKQGNYGPKADGGQTVPQGSSAPSSGANISERVIREASDPRLTLMGQGNLRLTHNAAAKFRQAEQIYGGQITITGAWRSWAEQEDCHRRKPTVCAPPGRSEHQAGEAVDVHTAFYNERIKQALLQAGFKQLPSEYWHFSLNGR